MRKLCLALLLLTHPTPAEGSWFEERRAAKEKKAAQKAAEQESIRKKAEQMRRRLWREKQYSKIVDGLKDHLAKGRFKYLAIGFMGGTIITATGVWYFCHDGCRFFNPVPPPPYGDGES